MYKYLGQIDKMWSTLRSVFEPYIDNAVVSTLTQLVDNHRGLTAVTAGLLLYGVWFFKRPKNLPPGPYGYPLVGCLHLIDKAQQNKFREKYGDIVCLWIGQNNYIVMLNSYDVIKEAYIKSGSIFMDRGVEALGNLDGVKDTIFNAHFDEKYKASRKTVTLCLRTLISSGLGNIMAAELTEMEKGVDSQLEKSVDVLPLLRTIFANTITQVLWGKRYNDQESEIFMGKLHRWNEYLVDAFLSLNMPWYFLIFFYKRRSLVRKSTNDILSDIKDSITLHTPVKQDDVPQDVFSAFLQTGKYTEKEIIETLFALMPDAAFTSPLMAMWILIYLTNHPESQEEIHQEIKEVCGDGIDLSMRSRMPVTESFIMEVFRIVTPFKLTPQNRPLKATTLRGYNMPEFVDIMANIELVHYDPNIFPEPEVFKPKRFIKDGKIGNKQGFMPFGIGRRKCAGEALVRNNMFYIVSRLLLKYKMSSPDGLPLGTEIVDDRFIKIANTCKICFRRREGK